jgi:hypothetical protein
MEQNDAGTAEGNCLSVHSLREDILLVVVKELQGLANSCNKELTPKMLTNLFRRKRAYQKDWTKQVLRKKAYMIAGYAVMAIGSEPTAEELSVALKSS